MLFPPFSTGAAASLLPPPLGVWIGVTLWQIPLVGVVALSLIALLITPSGWSVMAAMGVILAAILLWLKDPVLAGVWLLQTALLAWNHRADLAQRPRLRRKRKRLEIGES